MSASGTVVEQVTGHGLVLPQEPEGSTRPLAVAYARYLASCYQRFCALEAHLPTQLYAAYGRVAGLVRAALRHNQRAMLRCFASPVIGTPLQCVDLRDELDAFRARIDSGAAQMLPNLLFEMGLRRLLPDGQSVVWEHGGAPLVSLALGGRLLPPEGASGWRFSASHLTALAGSLELGRLPLEPESLQRALVDEPAGFRFERRYWRTGKASRFGTLDHNPIAAFEAHPEKNGNHVDLGERSAAEWVRMLDESFALIEKFLPGEFAEMGMLLHEIIPVGYHPERHLSASYREAIGTVYLTLHPNLMTMTEAIVHEFQHNKFNVSAHSVDYLHNAFYPLYKSPVRPDPRPLWGILLAVHAFLPVAELYRCMRDGGHPLAASPEFTRRMSEIDLKNHEGMEMLRGHAELTPAGRAMFDELEALESRHLSDRAGRGLDSTPTEIHLA